MAIFVSYILNGSCFRYAGLLIILLTIGAEILAYPINPVPLRILIAHSDCIVVATVDDPKGSPPEEKFFSESLGDTVTITPTFYNGDGLAHLHIQKVLKGSVSSSIVQVSYGNTSCPAPAQYPDQQTVIAFLVKSDTPDSYRTLALSYGSKLMDSTEELRDYQDRIYEYLDIMSIRNRIKRKRATQDWLVSCAEKSTTRWEGAYELNQARWPAKWRPKRVRFAKNLNQQQQQKLYLTFTTADSIGSSELLLVDVLEKEYHEAVTERLLQTLQSTEYWFAFDIMMQIIRIAPNDHLEQIREEIEDVRFSFEYKSSGKQKELIDRFTTLVKSYS